MLVVVDTNILVSAIKSKLDRDNPTKSQRLFMDIISGNHTIVISTPILREYEDVLSRSYLKLNPILVERFLAFIKINSIWIEPLPTKKHEVDMVDEDDRAFFDAAKCMNAKLVTGNLKHYPVHELRTSLDELYGEE